VLHFESQSQEIDRLIETPRSSMKTAVCCSSQSQEIDRLIETERGRGFDSPGSMSQSQEIDRLIETEVELFLDRLVHPVSESGNRQTN